MRFAYCALRTQIALIAGNLYEVSAYFTRPV
jgi:hypothetical protein